MLAKRTRKILRFLREAGVVVVSILIDIAALVLLSIGMILAIPFLIAAAMIDLFSNIHHAVAMRFAPEVEEC